MRRTWLSIVAVATLLGGAAVCPAQQPKPLVTVSFAGYQELMSSVNAIGQLGGQPQMSNMLEGMLQMATGGRGLAGLDKARPWGAVVLSDGQEFSGYGFVPVSDLDKLMGVLQNTGAQVQQRADGGWEIATGQQPLVVKQQGNWAFLSPKPEALANLPEDPATLLGDLPQKYLVAVRASIQDIPQQQRDQFIGLMQMGVAMGMQRQPGESDAAYALRTGTTRKSIDKLVRLAKELDQILVGLAMDQTANRLYLDLQTTAVPGSNLAEEFAQMQATTTNFAGVDVPGAAVTVLIASPLSDADVQQTKTSLADVRKATLSGLKDEGLKPDEIQLATKLVNDLFDVLDQTLDTKKMDAGAVLLLDPGAVTFVSGGAIAGGQKLETALKTLVGEIQKDQPEIGQMVTLDAETHQGIRFHKVSVPIPPDEQGQMLQGMVGPNLDVIVGIGDQAAYVAAGRNAADVLKQVIDKSQAEAGKQVPPMRMVIAASPILKFVSAVAPEPEVTNMAGMVGNMLAQSPGKDHLVLTTSAIPNGSQVRIEIEEGLLKILASLPALIGAGGPGGPPPMGGPPTDVDDFGS